MISDEQFRKHPDPRRQIELLSNPQKRRESAEREPTIAKHWTANINAPSKVRGRMNKTESRYADILDRRQQSGIVLEWRYEAMTFRLTTPVGGKKALTYTPDFMVLKHDGTMEFVEVKGGFATNESLNRLKVASEMFPWFCWVLAEYVGGEWTENQT